MDRRIYLMSMEGKMKKILIASLAVTALVSSGCAPQYGGSDYSDSNIGEVSKTYEGVIIAKRVVNLNASDNGVGALAGGVAGFGLGQAFGGGRGRTASAALGTVAGAAAGNMIGKNLAHQKGFEYQVKMSDTKEVLSIAQGQEPNLSVGQSVYIIKSNQGRSRIIAR